MAIEREMEPGLELWGNNVYQVLVRDLEPKEGSDSPPMKWLSIKRRDRRVVRDWRDFQTIKNDIVGPECEGVELFPAEERLVDTCNQYHLWVIAVPGMRFSFGYGDRLVMDTAEAAELGAVQRRLGATSTSTMRARRGDGSPD